jgi:hypothetical protein
VKAPWWERADLRVDRLIYSTITLMSVLIVYDGWATLSFGGVLAVIVGPILAIFLGHYFAATLGTRVALGRPLKRTERQAVLNEETRFLLLLAPPVIILVVLTLAGVAYTRTIQVIVFAGVLSLGFWGGVAGRRAQLTGWRLVGSVAYGLVMGGFILGLQAILRPGHGTIHALAALSALR